MGTDDDLEVEKLDQKNAWELFQQKVRGTILASDPKILDLAKQICERCQGLPLALNVIGETMACKTSVHEWQYAIDVLNTNAANYPEVKDEILTILKISYDDLKDETVQQCFQYCALFSVDDKIYKDMLVEYWISEGIINGGFVTMHDVIRQMALWVASNLVEEVENFIVKTGDVLLSMPKLVILDLSSNINLTRLPEEVTSLVSLPHLDLSGTSLEKLACRIRKVDSVEIPFFGRHTNSSKHQCDIKFGEHRNAVVKFYYLFKSGVDRGYQVNEEFDRLGAKYVPFATDISSLRSIMIQGEGPSSELQEIVSREKVSGIQKEGIEYCTLSKTTYDSLSLFVGTEDYLLGTIGIAKSKENWYTGFVVVVVCSESYISIPNGAITGLARNCKQRKGLWLELPCLKKLLISVCPKLKKLPFSKERAYYFDLHAHNEEWFERLEWEDEATED
ncbi:hypothetical protein F2Q69_00060531 [Brassica cretica]|uniref:NB-ARC domain-containing protein n=1 Tax=Brassica cretica TaxID=69181 RepID=A0A8S9RDX7_BRACR|nr:hypothetical protein F2Q69_00060531 [Brassica cretica]